MQPEHQIQLLQDSGIEPTDKVLKNALEKDFFPFINS